MNWNSKINRTPAALAALILAIACDMPSAGAQTLNRLFTTPSQRAALDQARDRVASGFETVLPEVPEPPPITVAEPPQARMAVFVLGGTMVRADGRFQVWINDQMYDPDSLPANMEMLMPLARGRLRITDPESSTAWTLSPGQTLNMTTGLIYEAYQLPTAGSLNSVDSGP